MIELAKKGIGIIALAGLMLFGLWAFNYEEATLGAATLKAPPEKILGSKSVVMRVCDNPVSTSTPPVPCGRFADKTVVKYIYASNQEVPNEVGEDKGRRTRNTKVFPLENGGTTMRIYAGEPFYEDPVDKKWYQTETATTTPEEFAAVMGTHAFAQSEEPYAGAGDGHAAIFGTGYSTWDLAHDETSAPFADYTSNENWFAGTGYQDYQGSNFNWKRGLVPFDTSAIPSGATITAATLNLYLYSVGNAVNDGTDYLNVVETTQPDHTDVVAGDYDNVGSVDSPTTGATSIDLGDISTSAYTVFTLNATGLGWIKTDGESSTCGTALTGWTCLGVREGHDLEDSNPSYSLNDYNQVALRYSEYTGTASDPYLSVTYTTFTGNTPSIIFR
jgi:hypothetical protein